LAIAEQGMHSIKVFSVSPSGFSASRLGVGKRLGRTQLGQLAQTD